MAFKQIIPKPDWLKVKAPGGAEYSRVKTLMHGLKLHTVCEEARCPNMAECWGGGTATMMLMGDTCTRACRFCHVKSGNPKGVLDELEPERVARAIAALGLKYVVLTSVDRDDLPDGGADHFATTIEKIKILDRNVLVEALVPDFSNLDSSIERVVSSGVDVYAQNLETVDRLTETVRDIRSSYCVTLTVLKKAKQFRKTLYTKSSLMLGLGEKDDEVLQSLEDLRSHDVDVVTLGQYLRPTQWHLPVVEYVHPDKFKMFEEKALAMGFLSAPSGPLVRSSYRAGEKFLEGLIRRQKSTNSVDMSTI